MIKLIGLVQVSSIRKGGAPLVKFLCRWRTIRKFLQPIVNKREWQKKSIKLCCLIKSHETLTKYTPLTLCRPCFAITGINTLTALYIGEPSTTVNRRDSYLDLDLYNNANKSNLSADPVPLEILSSEMDPAQTRLIP
jgi:hypothetical protein